MPASAPPQPFLSAAPEVRLTRAFEAPFANFLATARTCYSSKGVIGDVELNERWTDLAKSLYMAGHHTTLQHAQFQFALSNVSRHFLWAFLHSHPFYNSEQVSQRYVEVKPGNVAVPPLEGEALTRYRAAVERQMEDYRELIRLLTPVTADAYFERFPGRRAHADRYAKEIGKRAQEVARYALPVATFAYLYHTVSGITLLRYARRCGVRASAQGLARQTGLMPFRTGAFQVAVQSGIPVVPAALRGVRSVLRDGRWYPRRAPVAVTFGAPVAPDGEDWAAAVRLRDRVRADILRHCGEPDLAASS